MDVVDVMDIIDDFATMPCKLWLNAALVSRFVYLISFHFISFHIRLDTIHKLTLLINVMWLAQSHPSLC